MFETNEYFNRKVISIAFTDYVSNATIGVMANGEYELGTSRKEEMTVISGTLSVLLPNTAKWEKFTKFQTFVIEPNNKFKVKVEQDSSYICRYF